MHGILLQKNLAQFSHYHFQLEIQEYLYKVFLYLIDQILFPLGLPPLKTQITDFLNHPYMTQFHINQHGIFLLLQARSAA